MEGGVAMEAMGLRVKMRLRTISLEGMEVMGEKVETVVMGRMGGHFEFSHRLM
jgi:hypothetical protein